MNDSQQYVGRTLDNRYRLDRVVGVGGMAFVYEAYDKKTGARVALKLLKEKFSDDSRAVKRFINESKSLGLLNHPNIVKIYDISIKVDYKYIVMEYVDGMTLRKYMNSHRPLPWSEAVDFVEQIALALDNAHTKGIVHRDIKPQNIMIMPGGKLKVTDFGIAKMPNSESLTMADKAIGTVYYISPEQASSRKIDARSDIYSLGAMFYEMVTGQMPFTADSPVAIIMQHMQNAPVPPTKIVPSLPKGLEQIILCAMEKNPRNRYQSAAQMLRHLRRLKMDEKTVFNIMKPAPHTNTSEITLRKTARHSHDSHDSQNDQNLAVKKTGSGGLQTKKSPLGTGETTGPTQKPGTSVTNNGGNKSGGNSSGGSKTGGNSSGGNKPIGNNSGRKKKKFNYVTTFLVVIIILLVLAIWGIISLIFSPGNTDQSVFLPHTQDIIQKSILYLKQGIL
jgi:serine/threonine-protein kinase